MLVARIDPMADDDRLGRFLRTKLRSAGREYERARQAFTAGKLTGEADDAIDEDRARIVCRRYAERRAVPLDGAGRPACFEAGHADCEGCAEDLREGRIETW